MHTEAATNLADEIMRLARRIRRYNHHRQGHVTRLDRLLQLLLVNEGISLRDLACLMDMRPPSVSEWLDKLLVSGDVNKKQDSQDRRMVRISLTAKGRKRALAAEKKVKQSADIFAGCLEPATEKAFVESCRRLHQHLQEQGHHQHGAGHKSPGSHKKHAPAGKVGAEASTIRKEGFYG